MALGSPRADVMNAFRRLDAQAALTFQEGARLAAPDISVKVHPSMAGVTLAQRDAEYSASARALADGGRLCFVCSCPLTSACHREVVRERTVHRAFELLVGHGRADFCRDVGLLLLEQIII